MRNTDLSPTQWWGLTEIEKPWIEIQPHLESRGYLLRPRYRRGWQPSWPEGAPVGDIIRADDSIKMHPGGIILDAVRISDGREVVIKQARSNTQEVVIGRLFSSHGLESDPANHCVPILDSFPDPRDDSHVFIVMPVLRRWHDPPFRTIGEFVDFIEQLLRGLNFMHSHNLAHRDIASSNIMMDGTSMYPGGFHPYAQHRAKDYPKHRQAKALTRTEALPKYYFIDFGISSHFADQVSRSSVVGTLGRTKAPELSLTVPYDPFAVDIFAMGVFLLEEIEGLRGIEFLRPLARAMTQRDPRSRPSAEESLRQFEQLQRAVGRRKLTRFLFHRDDGLPARIAVIIYRTLGLSGLVAIGLTATIAFRFRHSLFRA